LQNHLKHKEDRREMSHDLEIIRSIEETLKIKLQCIEFDKIIDDNKFSVNSVNDKYRVIWHGHNWALRGIPSLEVELTGYSEYWRNKIIKNTQETLKIQQCWSLPDGLCYDFGKAIFYAI
jgi:hypothetical protein